MNTSRFKIAFFAIVLVSIIPLSIAIVLTSCGKDEPENEGSLVGQWELINLDDLVNNVLVSPYGVFSETDGIVFEFKEDGTMIQYLHTHNTWYIAGRALYWITKRNDKKSGRNLADTLVVYNSPDGKVEERDAADHNAYPCQILAPRLTGSRKNEGCQQEYSADECHRPSCKEIVDLPDHIIRITLRIINLGIHTSTHNIWICNSISCYRTSYCAQILIQLFN